MRKFALLALPVAAAGILASAAGPASAAADSSRGSIKVCVHGTGGKVVLSGPSHRSDHLEAGDCTTFSHLKKGGYVVTGTSDDMGECPYRFNEKYVTVKPHQVRTVNFNDMC